MKKIKVTIIFYKFYRLLEIFWKWYITILNGLSILMIIKACCSKKFSNSTFILVNYGVQ
jgi:hypothetical protein